MLLSADDFLPHNLVIHDFMLCFFEEEGLDYVYGDLLLVDQHGKNAGLWTYQEYGDEELVRTIFQRGGSGIVPMVGMFKTSYYQQKGFTWLVDPQKPLAGDVLNCLANTKRGWKRRYLKNLYYATAATNTIFPTNCIKEFNRLCTSWTIL